MPDSTLSLRRQPRDSLATKIIFFVFSSTFLTALVVSWISVQSTYSFLRTHLDAAFPLLLERAAARLERSLVEARDQTAGLAADPALVRLATGDRSAGEEADRVLARFLERQPDFAGVLVSAAPRPAGDADALLASASTVALPSAIGRGDRVPTEPALAEVESHLVVSAPLRDAAGATRAVLHAVLRPGAVRSHLVAAGAHEEAELHLVDRAGRVITSSAAEDEWSFEAFPVELVAGPPGQVGDFRAAPDRRGIGAYAPLVLGDLGVVVAQPLEAAFAPVFSVVTRVFVIDLAIILVFSFLAYEITAKIVRPLEALAEGARRISQGELEVEIDDTGTHDELGLLTRTFQDMAQRLRRNRDEIDEQHRCMREQNEELQRANEVLEQLSITDGLTKLHNHRYFQESLTREIKRATRSAEPLSILLVDIDDFKALNDRHGHAQGDAVLVRIARVLNESVRESDVLARYGGEEFVVLAIGTDIQGALFVAEKLRTAVAESVYVAPDTLDTLRVTVSIGVAEFAGDRKRFFDGADRALYRAKGAGKNCVMAATPDDVG
jgi:diguanylate cyclase (GGDEF)-like protein